MIKLKKHEQLQFIFNWKVVVLVGSVLFASSCLRNDVISQDKESTNYLQLARLDISTETCEDDIYYLISTLQTIKFIKTVKYFKPESSVVIAYSNLGFSNEKLLNTVWEKTGIRVRLIKPTQEELVSGCPFHNSRNKIFKLSEKLIQIFTY
jgi:hypothetical protein